MFDIGFWELATIAVIGIVVVGPQRLPEVVRTIAIYVRKVRSAFNNVKSDIERELELDELRRQLQESDLEDPLRQLNQSVHDIDHDIRSVFKHDDTNHGFDDAEVLAAQEQNSDGDTEYPQDEYADTGVEQPTSSLNPAPSQRPRNDD